MHWPTFRLRGELDSLELVMVLTAILAGAIVGSERERHDKPAGLRTLILVCLGSAVFTMVSYAFTTTTGDSGRVAAQVVTGIGFLGAGAILHSRTTVSGMTTAAAIWMMAAVGIVIGVGRPVAGLALAVLVRLILAGVRRWEIRPRVCKGRDPLRLRPWKNADTAGVHSGCVPRGGRLGPRTRLRRKHARALGSTPPAASSA